MTTSEGTPYRHAVFACPPKGSALAALAARWLARDAFTGEGEPQPDVEGIEALTAFPRRYGFHATVVAPFRPAAGVGAAEVDAALDTFCTDEAPLPLPLKVGRLGAFFALVPAEPSQALDAMAARAVRHFHHLRAAPTPDETAKRRPERLSPRQRELLRDWHYPYVLDEFRYHMTLTGPVPDSDASRVREAIEAHFPTEALRSFSLDALARYEEPTPSSPFQVAHRVPFTPPATSVR